MKYILIHRNFCYVILYILFQTVVCFLILRGNHLTMHTCFQLVQIVILKLFTAIIWFIDIPFIDIDIDIT